MAIKILKTGRLPEEVTYKFVCNHCATEFTAQAKDGKLGFDQREGNWLEVACPLCQHKCTSWNEHKEPELTHTHTPIYGPGVRGWQDYVLETNPHNR